MLVKNRKCLKMELNGLYKIGSLEQLASNIHETLKKSCDRAKFDFMDFEKLYDILKSDDVIAYRKICDVLQDEEKGRFANADFVFSPREGKKDRELCGFESIFILSVTLAAKNCLVEMIQNGADVFQTDPYSGSSWVHAIIEVVSAVPDLEETMADVYDHVIGTMSHGDRRKLLMMEGAEGYRALELATKCGAFVIATSLLETVGGYMDILETRGLQTYVKYWFSEYGFDGERRNRSPLLFLAYCKRHHISSLNKSQIMKLEVVKRLVQLRMNRCLPFLSFYCLLWICYICALLYFDTTHARHVRGTIHPNASSVYHRSSAFDDDTYSKCLLSIGILSGVFVFLDIVVVISKLTLKSCRNIHWRDFLGLHDHVAQTNFYVLVQTALHICSFISYTWVGFEHGSANMVMNFKCTILPLCIFSTMYTLEFLPIVGLFVLMMQAMVVTTVKFLIVDFILLNAFGAYFHDVTYSAARSYFTTYSMAQYSMFQLEQSDFAFGADPPPYIQFAHLVFYFLTVILLFNFLIAVLSDAVSNMGEIKDDIMTLRRLGTMLAIEDNVFRPVSQIFRKLGVQLPRCFRTRPCIIIRLTAMHRQKLV